MPLFFLAALLAARAVFAARPVNTSGGVELNWTQLRSPPLNESHAWEPVATMYDNETRSVFIFGGLTYWWESRPTPTLMRYEKDRDLWAYDRIGGPWPGPNICWWGVVLSRMRQIWVFGKDRALYGNIDDGMWFLTDPDPQFYETLCEHDCAVREPTGNEAPVGEIYCFGGKTPGKPGPPSPPVKPGPTDAPDGPDAGPAGTGNRGRGTETPLDQRKLSGVPTNSLRKLTLDGREWQWEEVDFDPDQAPEPRVGLVASFDPSYENLYIYGGQDEVCCLLPSRPLFDLWSFNVRDKEWKWIHESRATLLPAFAVMEFMSSDSLMLLHGDKDDYDVQALIRLQTPGNASKNISNLRSALTTELTQSPIFDKDNLQVANAREQLYVYTNFSLWYLQVTMPPVVGTCTPDQVDRTNYVTCTPTQCTNELCLGLAAGVRAHMGSEECDGSDAYSKICQDWARLKAGMRWIFIVTIVDITADVVNVVVVTLLILSIMTGCLGRWPKVHAAALSLSWICFMLDVGSQATVIQTARNLEALKLSDTDCFSVGEGAATMVKIEDLLGDTGTFGIIMLLIAILGGIGDAVDSCCGDSDINGQRQALINVMTLAALELSLGVVDLVANQMELVEGLQGIEVGIANLGYLADGRSFTCTMLSPQREEFRMAAVRPQALQYILATLIGLGAWCFSAGCIYCLIAGRAENQGREVKFDTNKLTAAGEVGSSSTERFKLTASFDVRGGFGGIQSPHLDTVDDDGNDFMRDLMFMDAFSTERYREMDQQKRLVQFDMEAFEAGTPQRTSAGPGSSAVNDTKPVFGPLNGSMAGELRALAGTLDKEGPEAAARMAADMRKLAGKMMQANAQRSLTAQIMQMQAGKASSGDSGAAPVTALQSDAAPVTKLQSRLAALARPGLLDEAASGDSGSAPVTALQSDAAPVTKLQSRLAALARPGLLDEAQGGPQVINLLSLRMPIEAQLSVPKPRLSVPAPRPSVPMLSVPSLLGGLPSNLLGPRRSSQTARGRLFVSGPSLRGENEVDV